MHREPEWIADADSPVEASVLEILRPERLDAALVGIRPEMGVEPGQLVERGAAQRGPHRALGWIEDRELRHHVVHLPMRLLDGEQGGAARERPRDHGNEFDDRLMRNEEATFRDAAAQQLLGPRLFQGEARVEAIDEDAGVNEGGHASTARRASSRGTSQDPGAAYVRGPAVASWPRRTAARAPPARAAASRLGGG